MKKEHLLHINADTKTLERWPKLALGDTAGFNEAWLRDSLQGNPEVIPIDEIDPAYGPLIPVCTELGTPSGRIDNVFINREGRLTLVECKLWLNPEARRKVVAQILDYAKHLSSWSYSQLEAQVNARLGKTGNTLYELVKERQSDLSESDFHDATTRALRQGRFMLLIAGDGIREDVEAIGALINRNAAAAFAFGMFEVAMYRLPDKSVVLQPRVLAKTKLIERTVVMVERADGTAVTIQGADMADEEPTGEPNAASKAHASSLGWWQGILDKGLSHPDQPALRYYWPHNVRTPLPWPNTWVTAYRASEGGKPVVGVMLSGREEPLGEVLRALDEEMAQIVPNLPDGTRFDHRKSLRVVRQVDSFASEAECKNWVLDGVNAFVNELRPRVRRLVEG
ncbi:hypothetical protein QTH87_00425 [Variovorax sp. J22P168]|uniref:hypothetical protein n=1 Tax=Variovorax jilinensis TaxID=3053513 RepID=UPI002577F951|nr:hypothetical protein [Variovorax sp. J22P168]MDM0010889.1 hypothetical protein [Variovorax sp. J22P168]